MVEDDDWGSSSGVSGLLLSRVIESGVRDLKEVWDWGPVVDKRCLVKEEVLGMGGNGGGGERDREREREKYSRFFLFILCFFVAYSRWFL